MKSNLNFFNYCRALGLLLVCCCLIGTLVAQNVTITRDYNPGGNPFEDENGWQIVNVCTNQSVDCQQGSFGPVPPDAPANISVAPGTYEVRGFDYAIDGWDAGSLSILQGSTVLCNAVSLNSGGTSNTCPGPSAGGVVICTFTVGNAPPCLSCPEVGDLVITEIMQNPDAVNDTQGEWFEVYNASSDPIDMNGIVISDDGGDSHTIASTSSLSINPGEYFVLARNGNFSTNGGVNVDYVYSGINLANGNSGDEVILTCQDTEIDRVNYDGGPAFPDPTGASMQLDPLTNNANDNNNGSNWCEATATYGDGDMGTPGSANTSCCNIAISSTPTTPVSCLDFNDGTLTINATGATTINYTIDGPGGMQSEQTGVFTDLMAGSYTITVSDANNANCSEITTAMVGTAPDNTDPIPFCPSNMTIGNAPGQCGAQVTFNIDVSDNCPGSTVSANPASGSFFPVGTTTVTVTATDAAGNMDECTFDVTVNDTEDPIPFCLGDITVGNAPSECGAAVTFNIDVSDNCPGATVSANPASGSFFELGTTTVTVTATDAAGNMDECTFDVTVNDTEDPVAFCPGAGMSSSMIYGSGTVGLIPPTGTSGVSTYTLNVPDNVTISDVNVINLSGTHSWSGDMDIILTSPANTSVQLLNRRCSSDDDFDLNFDDNAASGTPSCPLTGGNTFRPDNINGAILGDFNGENASGVWTLTIIDNAGGDSGNLENWELEFNSSPGGGPSAITVDNDPGQCGAAVTFNIDVSDNCPGATVSANPPSGSFFPVGTTTVTVTATDAAGNMDECTFDVTVNDVEAPVFDLACQVDLTFVTEDGNVCPANAIISLSEGDEIDVFTGWTVGGIPISSLQGCVDDNCTDESDLTITVDDITIVDDGTCSRIITITFIADDGNGNFSDPFVCNYTFIDDTAPVFDLACQIDATFFTEDGNVCPADATISLNEGDEIDAFTGWIVGGILIDPLGSCVGDNCTALAEVNITVDDITIVDDGTCSRIITITFIADDGCGNFSDPFVCNYTFIDDTAPVFDLACQIDATFFTEDGNVCPADATISLSEGDEIDAFTGWTVGGIPIDPLGSCVGDNCTALADVNITVDDITVVDDGTCSRIITITFIADDGCGNFSAPFVCNYTFIDNTGPEVSFNGIPDGGTYVVECDLPSSIWDPLTDIGELTLSDNCSAVDVAGITEVLTQLYDGPCVGNMLTRWQQVFTVMDVCGNTTVYTLFTEIIDTTPPAFTESPDDVTIECDETAATPELEAFDSCSEVIYGFTEVRTDGDCPNNYTLTRTWTATDGCGNASDEVQIVTVEDTTPPEIEFVNWFINPYESDQDVYIACSQLGNILSVSEYNVKTSDNCSGATPVEYRLDDLGYFDCLEFGYVAAYISTWTSTDECGNTATATINWFLVDQTPPVLRNVPEDTCADANNLPPVAEVDARDQCEFAELNFSQSDPIDCDGGQYIERTWTATDICGNTISATQRITLSGANGPAIIIDYPGIGDVMNGDLVQIPIDCDQDIDLAVAELEAAISVNGGCGSGESSIELSLVGDGNCQEDGYIARYQLNIRANDPCNGDEASLELTIDFVDQTPPLMSGPAAITLNCGDDIPKPTVEDACGEVGDITFTDNAPIMASCSSDPIAYERTWMVSDACGNAATFVQSIMIIDNEGPVFSHVPDDTCNDTSLGEEPVTAYDNCSGENVAVQFSEMTSDESGCGEVLTRLWTAVDACGNLSSVMQQVFFDDETAPEIVFSNPLLAGLESGDELFINVGNGLGNPNEPLFFTADDVLVTDNCATITAEVKMKTTISEDCAADGFLAQYNYKFIATDPCGNSNAIYLRVFYVDRHAPDFFNVPGDITVFCSDIPEVADITISDDYDEDVEVSFSETQTATADGLLIIRTWTAIDDCGNTSSVSREILVADNDLSASFSFSSGGIECNSDNNRLGVTAKGGMPPYSYEWQLTDPLEDGYITSDPSNRAILFTMGYITQTFTVIITDANGCEYTASVTIECDFSEDEGDFLIHQTGNNGSFAMNVYPNPADQSFRLTFQEGIEKPVTVGLYNLFGQELYHKKVQEWPAEGLEIDTQELPNGTYVLRIDREGQVSVSREIVILR